MDHLNPEQPARKELKGLCLGTQLANSSLYLNVQKTLKRRFSETNGRFLLNKIPLPLPCKSDRTSGGPREVRMCTTLPLTSLLPLPNPPSYLGKCYHNRPREIIMPRSFRTEAQLLFCTSFTVSNTNKQTMDKPVAKR